MNINHFYAIMAAFTTALIILINKKALQIVDPLLFGTWRSIIVVAGLIGINLFLNKNKIDIDKKELFYLLFAGSLGAISIITVLYGTSITSAINVGFLLNLSPVFVIVLAPLLVREKITKNHLFSLILMISGAFLILTGGQLTLLIGDLLIVITALLFGLSDLISRKALFKAAPITAACITNSISMCLLFLSLFITGFTIPNINQLFWISLSGVILVVFWISLFKSLKTIGANNTSLYSYLSPVFVVIGAFLFLGESMSLMKIFGGIAILLGAYLIPKK